MGNTRVMRFLLIPLMLVAGLGLLLCALAQLATIAGLLPSIQSRLSESVQMAAAAVLGGGIFAVWVPAVLLAQRINNGGRFKFSWKRVLAGCPPQMIYAVGGIFAYALVNFLLAIASRDTGLAKGVRLFSGHAMVFYGMAFCIFFSSWRRPDLLRTRYCPAGHEVAHEDSFCPVCGLAVTQGAENR